MRPSYNPGQEGFDFGAGNFLQDVCVVFDMSEFPKVEPEEIANRLRCKGEYALTVYRKAMEIWETTLDQEIVNELRELPNRDPMVSGMIAMVLNETPDQVESDLEEAMNKFAHALDLLENEDMAA